MLSTFKDRFTLKLNYPSNSADGLQYKGEIYIIFAYFCL